MSSAFISYSRKDKSFAELIAGELRKRGADVFIDYQRLEAGEDFIGRLGNEIKSRDTFILLLSPRSVASKWVQAEVAWALQCSKIIIPVLLEECSMVDFFFLIRLEQVDFTKWLDETHKEAAIHKLARALKLPLRPPTTKAETESSASSVVEESPAAKAELHESLPTPAIFEEIEGTTDPESEFRFTESNLTDLFITAVEVAEDDPEQAIFLYKRILEGDPEYADGQVARNLQREEKRVKEMRFGELKKQAEAAIQDNDLTRAENLAKDMLTLQVNDGEANGILQRILQMRLNYLRGQAEDALRNGKWEQAKRIAEYMFELQRNNADATRILNISTQNTGCDATYEHARIAAQNGRYGAAKKLLEDVIERCPDYRDWAGILQEEPIQAKWISFLNELEIAADLSEIKNKIALVQFSPGAEMLAFTHSVDLAESQLGESLAAFQVDIAESPLDDLLEFLTDSRNKLTLTNVSTLSDLYLVRFGSKEFLVFNGHTSNITCVALSPDETTIAAGTQEGTIHLWDIKSNTKIKTLDNKTKVIYMKFSQDGLTLSALTNDNIRIWDTTNYLIKSTVLHSLNLLTVHPNRLALSGDCKLLAYAAQDLDTATYTYKNHRIDVYSIQKDQNAFAFSRFAQFDHKSKLQNIVFSPSSLLLASRDTEGIKLWNLRKKEIAGSVRIASVPLEFSPDENLLVCLYKREVDLVDVTSQRLIWHLQLSESPRSIKFSSDGRFLMCLGGDGKIRRYGIR